MSIIPPPSPEEKALIEYVARAICRVAEGGDERRWETWTGEAKEAIKAMRSFRYEHP